MLFCPFFYRSLSLVAMEGLSMYVGGCIFGPSTALRLENQPTFCVFFFPLVYRYRCCSISFQHPVFPCSTPLLTDWHQTVRGIFLCFPPTQLVFYVRVAHADCSSSTAFTCFREKVFLVFLWRRNNLKKQPKDVGPISGHVVIVRPTQAF